MRSPRKGKLNGNILSHYTVNRHPASRTKPQKRLHKFDQNFHELAMMHSCYRRIMCLADEILRQGSYKATLNAFQSSLEFFLIESILSKI